MKQISDLHRAKAKDFFEWHGRANEKDFNLPHRKLFSCSYFLTTFVSKQANSSEYFQVQKTKCMHKSLSKIHGEFFRTCYCKEDNYSFIERHYW